MGPGFRMGLFFLFYRGVSCAMNACSCLILGASRGSVGEWKRLLASTSLSPALWGVAETDKMNECTRLGKALGYWGSGRVWGGTADKYDSWPEPMGLVGVD